MPAIYPYKDFVEIGRGGMATVYRATAPNGNLVALKVLAVHLASDATARMRFEQESNLRLTHPNIVRVLDWGIDEESPFIVMDYIVGESLDRRLTRDGTLSPQQLLPILRDTASALDYAHSRGVIHRDVKPSNILIRSSKQALLGDFGVAKTYGITAYTATAARVGSVFYMSPEQANGAPELTYSSDIYSLGVTTYYALAGRHPFEADNEIAIARMHMDAKPKHVSDINPAVPRAIGNVVMQALEKDPLKRLKSAGAFARAFEAAILQSSRPTVVTPWLRLAGAAALIVASIVVGVVSVQHQVPAQPAYPTDTHAPTPTQTASPQNEVVVNMETPAMTPVVATSPSATASATAIPTSSATATASMTPSPIETATPRPTKAPVATRIIRQPTNTPRPTNRPVLTRTPQPTAQETPTKASPTSTAIVGSPTAVGSPTPLPTVKSTSPPTVAPPTVVPATVVPPTVAPPTVGPTASAIVTSTPSAVKVVKATATTTPIVKTVIAVATSAPSPAPLQ